MSGKAESGESVALRSAAFANHGKLLKGPTNPPTITAQSMPLRIGRTAPNLSTATYWWMGLAGAVGTVTVTTLKRSRCCKAFPVLRDRELVGCIMAKDVRDLPPGDRTRMRVADIMHPCSPEIIVPPDLEPLDALVKMQSGQHSRLFVVEQGHLRGILALSDMLQYPLKQGLDRTIQDSSLGASGTGPAGTAPQAAS
jgi:CBS domain-containing protein